VQLLIVPKEETPSRTSDLTAAVTQAENHPSVVDLTADNSILNRDILVDATSSANVKLEHKSILKGAINENSLTGATGINPTEQVTHPISPGRMSRCTKLGAMENKAWFVALNWETPQGIVLN
jgi:hypothetical protein